MTTTDKLFVDGQPVRKDLLRKYLVTQIENISTLRLVPQPGEDGLTVYVRGYRSAGDGGEGAFHWNATNEKDDDGGMIIRPGSNPSRGRWLRNSDGASVSCKWFGAVGDGVTNDTVALQAALDFAWENSCKLVVPPGTYRTSGLTLAGTSNTQHRILQIEGAGVGNPFACWTTPGGSTFVGMANAPVLTVDVPSVTTSAGTLRVSGIVFDGNSSTPVVYLKAFYGVGDLSQFCIFQRGTGDGLKVDWMATSEIHNFYILNKDWMKTNLGDERTGIGLFLNQQYDSGLQSIRKGSSRGFQTAFKVGAGSGTHYTYSASIRDCECSCVYHGVHLTSNARSTVVDGCYLEGGEGGNGLWDEGDYNKINHCFTFAGFGTHLKSTSFTYGNSYSGNTFTAGTDPNQILADITSSSNNGGPGKVVTGNHFSFGGSGGSLTGVIGMRINGVDPRIDLSGNTFYPRGPWVGGAGTVKINDVSDGGVFGMTTAQSGDGNVEMPMLSRGAVAFEMAPAGLSQLNVASSVLSLPGGSLFYCNATSAVTVNRLAAGNTGGRLLIFNLQNTNMTFANSSYLLMSGGTSFSGRGHIVFYTQIIGGGTYAYEICRSTY